MTQETAVQTRIQQQRQELSLKLDSCGPILRGSLIERFTVCSRPGCRCIKGKKHGPYLYLSAFDGKRSRLVYVPQDLESEVRSWVQNYQEISESLAKLSDLSIQLIRQRNPKPARRDSIRSSSKQERKGSR